jgi:HK97 family phage major capsid protein
MKYKLTQALRDYLLAKGWIKAADASEADVRSVVDAKIEAGELTVSKLADLVDGNGIRNIVKEAVQDALGGQQTPPHPLFGKSTVTPTGAFGGGNGNVSGKRPSEMFCQKRVQGRHEKTGAPVLVGGTPVELPSQSDRALIGTWFKRVLRRSGLPCAWGDVEESLWQELLADHVWTDARGAEPVYLHGPAAQKALLDDSVSGGLGISPTILDDTILVNLVLNSELAPYVDVRDIGRGRIVRTGLMGRVTSTFGIPDGTATPLFDTTNLLGSVDTTIFDLKGACEFGNDLASDSVVNVADLLIESITDDMLAKLDASIATGDGVIMPTGLASTSGLTTVASVNGVAGPITLGDLENLIFAVGLAYRRKGGFAFVGNETNYRRLRSLATATGWNTRLFGEDYSGTQYNLVGYPYRVSADLPNSKLIFAGLKNYRLFRRQGIQTRVESGGKELTLKNMSLLFAIARFGGRLLDAKAAAVITDLAP